MNILSAFGFKQTSLNAYNGELPEIYKDIAEFDPFVTNDLISLFSKILTDCLDRTQGIKPKWEHALWDNCLVSEGRKGLVTLLAEAMAQRTNLFLVYKEDVLRLATEQEQKQIESDYAKAAGSKIGVFVSFEEYRRSEILAIYSAMEYCILNALNKTLNLSQAIQFKMSKMRDAVGLVDSSEVIRQAVEIAAALADGRDVMLDGDDEIVTAVPDLTPTQTAIRFLDAKRSFILNLPLSYITGEQTPGIGSTGEADTKAVERGLRSYWISIIKPTIKALFGADVTFKSQDFRLIGTGLEALKTFDLVSHNIISLDNKRLIASQLLNVDNDMEGEPDLAEEQQPNVDSSGSEQNPAQGGTEDGSPETNNPKADGQQSRTGNGF